MEVAWSKFFVPVPIEGLLGLFRASWPFAHEVVYYHVFLEKENLPGEALTRCVNFLGDADSTGSRT